MTNNPKSSKPKLLDQVRAVIRLRSMSYRTEQTYCDWIKRFILFHNKRHPSEMGVEEIRAFLTHLVVEQNVAGSTQNQALHSLLFLYKQVLNLELPFIGGLPVTKKQPRLPVVFTREEAQAILAQLSGEKWLMASLLYGSGLRLSECFCKNLSERLSSNLKFRNTEAVTPCATASLHICSKRDMTFALCRNCSATPMSKLRWCIRTF